MHNSMRNKIPEASLRAVVQKLDPSLKFVSFIQVQKITDSSHLSDTICVKQKIFDHTFFTCLLIIGHFH